MISPIQLINNYKEWYIQSIKIFEEISTEYGKVFEVHIPAFNKNSESMSFYISCQRNKIIVTDVGFIVSNLRIEGIAMTDSKIETIKNILKDYNLEYDKDDNEIFFEIVQDDFLSFNRRFQDLIYAITEINALQSVISSQNLWKLFVDEVNDKLLEKNIKFNTQNKAKIKGKYKEHQFQFVILPVKKLPPIYIKISNEIKENNILLDSLDLDENTIIHNLYHRSKEIPTGIKKLIQNNPNTELISRNNFNDDRFFLKKYSAYL